MNLYINDDGEQILTINNVLTIIYDKFNQILIGAPNIFIKITEGDGSGSFCNIDTNKNEYFCIHSDGELILSSNTKVLCTDQSLLKDLYDTLCNKHIDITMMEILNAINYLKSHVNSHEFVQLIKGLTSFIEPIAPFQKSFIQLLLPITLQ